MRSTQTHDLSSPGNFLALKSGEPLDESSEMSRAIASFNITGVADAYARLSKDPARQARARCLLGHSPLVMDPSHPTHARCLVSQRYRSPLHSLHLVSLTCRRRRPQLRCSRSMRTLICSRSTERRVRRPKWARWRGSLRKPCRPRGVSISGARCAANSTATPANEVLATDTAVDATATNDTINGIVNQTSMVKVKVERERRRLHYVTLKVCRWPRLC